MSIGGFAVMSMMPEKSQFGAFSKSDFFILFFVARTASASRDALLVSGKPDDEVTQHLLCREVVWQVISLGPNAIVGHVSVARLRPGCRIHVIKGYGSGIPQRRWHHRSNQGSSAKPLLSERALWGRIVAASSASQRRRRSASRAAASSMSVRYRRMRGVSAQFFRLGW